MDPKGSGYTLDCVQRYDASRLVLISEELARIWDDTSDLGKESSVSPDKAADLNTAIQRIHEELRFLGLKITSASAQKMLLKTGHTITRGDVEFFVGEIASRFHDEVADLKFLYSSNDRFLAYGQTDAFGTEVTTRFADAAYDIQEASNCLALGLYTASVFHCMRILEHGLRHLAEKLDVKLEYATWGSVLNEIEGAIKAMATAARKPKMWKIKRQFYSEAATHFTFVKDAWRNYAAHGEANYDERQADKIFRNTRDFMQHLAQKR